MRKILTVLTALLMFAGLVSVAQASDTTAPPAKAAPSAATVKSKIKSGKLKAVSAKKAAKLTALAGKNLKTNAGAATVGSNYIGSYREYDRLWYDYYSSWFVNSNDYYGYYYYKNWKVCDYANSYCYAAGSYDYAYYAYYYGTWYWSGFYGPYKG